MDKRSAARRSGWCVIGVLTALWLVGTGLSLQGLLVDDSFYNRLDRMIPGILAPAGQTCSLTLIIVWTALLILRWRRRHAPVPHLTREELLELEPQLFEQYVASLFTHKGYKARHRGRSGDHGVDLEVIPPSGRLGIVQCKRHRTTVGEKVVRDLYGTMLHEKAGHAFLVTAGDISAAAHNWAADKPMTLVDGNQLIKLVRELR